MNKGEVIGVMVGDELRAVVANADLMTQSDDVLALCANLEGIHPKMLYCDPPWTPGIYNMFRGQSGAARDASGEPLYPIFSKFLEDFSARCARFPVAYIEMGKQYQQELITCVARSGLPVTNVWDVTYGGGKPSTLQRFSRGPSPSAGIDLAGIDDERCVGLTILREELTARDWVYDPCLGIGATSRACVRANVGVVGSELVLARAEKSLAWVLARLKKARTLVLGKV